MATKSDTLKIIPLTYKHIANWRRYLEAAKPADVPLEDLGAVPADYFVEISVDGAFQAGWFGPKVTREDVEGLPYLAALDLSSDIWDAYQEAHSSDPN